MDGALGSVIVFAAAAGGWYAGLLMYRWTVRVVFGQRVSAGDVTAVGMWIAIAVAFTIPFAYLPVIAWLHARVAGNLARFALGLLSGAALAPLPASIVALLWSGGRITALWSSEYALMLVWAGVLGACLVAGASLHPTKASA